ncbi:hypothetical protein T01_4510, partial [Trichinella spiralis]
MHDFMKTAQMLLESATFARGAQVSLPSLSSPLKSHQCITVLQYLGKYAFVRRATRKFWKVLLHTNPYLLNKWPLKFACAYLNTQKRSPSGTPLKRLQNGNIFYIIVRYSLKLRSLVQYLFVLGKSIFLHFPSNWNKFINIVSGRIEIAQVLFLSLTSPLKSHHCTTFLQYLGKYAFVRRATRRFWKVPWQTNPNLLNKWTLNFACAYLNTQESIPPVTPLKRLQDGRIEMLNTNIKTFIINLIFIQFQECRPRGHLVNQCLEQQSRNALGSFPQYRLQLG